MSVPNSSKVASVPELTAPLPAKDQLLHPAPALDEELVNWDTYYQMLLAGRLNKYAGEFIVIHQGSVIAHGANSENLRRHAAKQLGIAGDKLVIPFVDSKECIAIE